MSQFVVVNGVDTTLATAITTSSTAITLASSANLPTLASGQMIPLILRSYTSSSVFEIVYGTAISGAVITVARGMEGTSPQNFNVGDYVLCGPTAGSNALIVGILNPTASETLPNAYGALVLPGTLTAAITLTLPAAPPMGTSYTVFGANEAVTLDTGVTSGSPEILMPDGTNVYSIDIAAGSTGQSATVYFDGTNWRGSNQAGTSGVTQTDLTDGSISPTFGATTVSSLTDTGNATVGGTLAVTGVASAAAGTTGTNLINFTQINTGNGSLVGYNQGGTGAVEMTVQSKLQQNLNILDFGADPTGDNDSTSAIQDAINALNGKGGTIWIPPGAFVLASGLTLTPGVTLSGTMFGPFSSPTSSTYQNYPTLLITNTSTEAITMGAEDCQVRNLLIYYPDQVSPTASTPTAYPATIYLTVGSNGGYCVDGVTFVNAYTAIAGNLARGSIRNCIIGAYNTGIFVDETEDYSFVDNVIFQIMWDIFEGLSYPQSIDTWVQNNNGAMQIMRADEIKVSNVGFFGQGTAITLTDSSNASLSPRCGYGTFVNIDIDTCRYGVNAISSNASGRGYSFIGTGIGATDTNMMLNTGGTQAPLVFWYSGFSRKATSPYTVSSGTLLVERVDGVNALMGTTSSDGITAPAIPANETYVYNPFPFAVMVYIWGGVVGYIAINNQTITVPSSDVNESVRLGVGDEIALGYTTAPSWAWFRA